MHTKSPTYRQILRGKLRDIAKPLHGPTKKSRRRGAKIRKRQLEYLEKEKKFIEKEIYTWSKVLVWPFEHTLTPTDKKRYKDWIKNRKHRLEHLDKYIANYKALLSPKKKERK